MITSRNGMGNRAMGIIAGLGVDPTTVGRNTPMSFVSPNTQNIPTTATGGLPTMPALSTAPAPAPAPVPAMAQQPAPERSMLDRFRDYMSDDENRARMALAFNSMRFKPDAQLAQMLGNEIKDARARKESNRTLELLRQRNPEIARLVEQGLPINQAMEMVFGGGETKVVGKSLVRIKPDGTHEVVMRDVGEGDNQATSTFRTLEARAQAAGLQKGTPEYREFMMRGGANSGLSIQFNDDGTVRSISEGGANAFADMTGDQGKATMFATRMSRAQQVINQFEQEGTDLFNQVVGDVPLVGNLVTSPEFRQYDQAKRDFINAILRYESGAAIGQDEFSSASLQYFPVAGDDPATIAQKRRNRELAIQTMSAVSGGGADALAKQMRVQLLGPEAADWPPVGFVKDGMEYIGGDPNLEQNWKKK